MFFYQSENFKKRGKSIHHGSWINNDILEIYMDFKYSINIRDFSTKAPDLEYLVVDSVKWGHWHSRR